MKKFILLLAGFTFTCTGALMGQHSDSLAVKILPDLVVTGSVMSQDPVLEFYRKDNFSTSEQILERLNGFSTIRRGAYGQDPVIRGLGNGQINVTLDGMRMISACTDRMDPVTSYVDAVNLIGIDGITDITASSYGSTFGGSVNMLLQKPKLTSKGVTGDAGFQFGSAAAATTTYGIVNASGKAGAFRFSATHRRADAYRAGGGSRISYSQYEKLQLTGAGRWAASSKDTLTAEIMFDEGWNIGFPALPMDVGRARAGIFAVTLERAETWWHLENLRIKAYHNRIRHTMDDAARPDVIMPMDMPGYTATSGLFAEGNVHLFHSHITFMKAEYYSNTAQAEMIMYPAEGSPMYMQSAPKSTSQTIGYFVQQNLRLSGSHKLMVTFRADIVSQHLHKGPGRDQWDVLVSNFDPLKLDIVTTTGLSYSIKPGRSTLLKLQSGYGERVPTTNERYGYYLFNRYDGFDYVGNPALEKESAFNVEGTFSWYWGKTEFNITPYFKRIHNFVSGGIRNELDVMTPGALGVKQYANIPHANISGVDMLVIAEPVRSVKWMNTLKYTRGTASTGDPLPLMPPLKITSSMNYAFHQFDARVSFEYASRQRRVSESFGEDETSPFWIANINIYWRPNKTWSVSAGFENAFDRKYHEHLDWGGIPRVGRNVHMGIHVSY